MKGFIAVLLGIMVAVIIVGGAVAFNVVGDAADETSSVGNMIDKVSNVVSSDSSKNSVVGDTVKVIKEEIVESGQEEGLTYREVTYSDGGFRQYDVDSGKLIGSSYDSDRDKLPSME